VQKVIADRLGIGDKTQLKEGGYMDNLLKDNKVRSDIKKMSLREVMKGSGFKDFKQGLQQFIVGDEEKLGAFKQYYRNYAYDVYVQVDRDESMLMATDLVLQCFFYEGTIIDTSRPFCKERAGKLFTVEEAQAWESDPWIQNALKKGFITSYNPVADMGLWACRHVPRFVSNEVAAALRPELKAALGVKDSEIATPEQVQEHTVDMEALMKEDDSFDTYLNQKDNRKPLEEKQKEFPQMSVEQIAAVRIYGASGYWSLNRSLRNADDSNPGKINFEALLNQALDKLPDYDGVAFRGSLLGGDDLKVYQQAFDDGTPVTEKSFISSSREAQGAFEGNTTFFIKSKTGKLIEKVLDDEYEKEVLFKSKRQFKVTAFDKKKIDGKQHNEIWLEEN
jgi:hypothetical protein